MKGLWALSLCGLGQSAISSRYQIVRLDERIVGFVVMWARAVCNRFWVSAGTCFRCLLLFCGVFVSFSLRRIKVGA